jgi:ABC-type multidrug transport system ATPase subunit
MDEANLCDRIALIQNGKILSIDTPQNISAAFPDKLLAVKARQMSMLLKELSRFDKAKASYSFGEYAHVVTGTGGSNDQGQFEKDLKNYLQDKGLENVEVKAIKASVEDCFIKLLK